MTFGEMVVDMIGKMKSNFIIKESLPNMILTPILKEAISIDEKEKVAIETLMYP